MKPLLAQIRAEVSMTLRRGETLLLTLGLPTIFLVFFSKVHVVNVPTRHAVSFFGPGILALAVMSTSMVSLGIGTGFERHYGVLKRLGVTPLGRPRLLAAKIATIVAVEIVQAAVLVPVAVALGWHPVGGQSIGEAACTAVAVTVLGSIGFGGIGLCLAGRLRGEINLAVTNGLYLVLLLIGGMIVPLKSLPRSLASFARELPPGALSDALRGAFGSTGGVPAGTWVVLIVWACAAPIAAALLFRWE